MKKVISTAIAVVFVSVFATPVLAAGNSSSTGTYDKTSAKVQKVVGAKHTKKTKSVKKPTVSLTTTKPTTTSTLPFTGLDLGFIVAAGVVLVVLGVSLRRLSRTPPTA